MECLALVVLVLGATSMNGKGRNAKGSNYERELAKKLSNWTGENFMRTLQSGAGGTRAVDEIRMTGDLFAPLGSNSSFSYEAKNHASTRLNHVFNNNGDIPEFWKQATTDCRRVRKYGLSPMLLFHVTREADYVLLPYTDWLFANLAVMKHLPCQSQVTYYTEERTNSLYVYRTILTTLDALCTLDAQEVFKHYKGLDWDKGNPIETHTDEELENAQQELNSWLSKDGK